jgi:hypothetical protein
MFWIHTVDDNYYLYIIDYVNIIYDEWSLRNSIKLDLHFMLLLFCLADYNTQRIVIYLYLIIVRTTPYWDISWWWTIQLETWWRFQNNITLSDINHNGTLTHHLHFVRVTDMKD